MGKLHKRTVLSLIILALTVLAGATFYMIQSPFVSDVHRAQQRVQDRYAIVISGDGLKTSLATSMADKLAMTGITTARVRSLNYFWSARSPERMAKDLERQLRHRLKKKPDDRFILIGFSFGAGTLPFAVNRLPEDLIARVDGVTLLAPPASSDFEFFFRSWLNKSTNEARATAPEIETLSGKLPVLYMRGEDDYIGPSDVLGLSNELSIITLPGGHDFNKDYDRILQEILSAFPAKLREEKPSQIKVSDVPVRP